MVTSNMTVSRSLIASGATVLTMTAFGVLLGWLVPVLAGHTRPHPALSATLGTAAGILANNVRALALPFGLCLLGFPALRLSRHLGDLLVLAVVAVNTLTVGIELGRWRGQLIPYVPQLPLEWAALTIAVSAWFAARTHHADRRQLGHLAVAAVLLLVCAAAVETWGTPHKHEPKRASTAQLDTVRDPDALVGIGGCHRHGFCADPGPIASRSPAPFPSPRSVPLGRLVGADRAHNNHRPPQGGINR
jgi:hypothetical protein